MTILNPEQIIDLQGTTKDEILNELVHLAAQDDNVTNEQKLLDAILERESEATTGIGDGIAVPHAKISSVNDTVVVLGRSKNPISFNSLDEQPVSIFALIAVNNKMQKEYIRVLAKIAQFLKKEANRDDILAASNTDDVANLVKNIF